MANILIFDDNTFELSEYIQALRDSKHTVFTKNTQEGFYEILTEEIEVNCIILDVMADYNKEILCEKTTKSGYNTGALIARCLRSFGINTPIAFFTRITSNIENFDINDAMKSIDNSIIIRKHLVNKAQFCKIISELITPNASNQPLWKKLIQTEAISAELTIKPFSNIPLEIKLNISKILHALNKEKDLFRLKSDQKATPS